MKREEIFAKLFEFEFCEPNEKPQKEKEVGEIFESAVQETDKPMYVLKPAILNVYPQYRAKRLAKELPNLPFAVRGQ